MAKWELHELKRQLAVLEARLEPLLEDRRRLNAEISAQELLLIKAKWGLYEGMIVKRRGLEYQVVEISDKYGKPWLAGHPRRKDGSFGTVVRNLYNEWEMVEDGQKSAEDANPDA